MKQLQRVRAK